MRIALLEDDPDQAALVARWLQEAGHACHRFDSGRSILRAFDRESFDLLLLDWNVPDMSGLEVLRLVRQRHGEAFPVLFTTARKSEESIVTALKAGADDYVVKPLRRAELLARIGVLERRFASHAAADPVIALGPVAIDTLERRVKTPGGEVDLTAKEYELLLFLARNLGRACSRGHIQEAVWGLGETVSTRTVDTHASRLRSKLGLTEETPLRLGSVQNFGYRLELIDKPTASG